MADLQHDLRPAAAAGEFDDLTEQYPDEGVVAAEPYEPVSDPDDAPLTRAHAVLAAHPVADGYNGLPWALKRLSYYDLEDGESTVGTDVPRLRRGHVGALFWSLHLPEGLDGDRAVGATLEQLDLAKGIIRTCDDGLRPACTAGQVADARNCGRVAVLLGPAGASAVGDSLGTTISELDG